MIVDEVIEILFGWLVRGVVKNCVNVLDVFLVVGILVVRYLDEVGVLVSVFEVLEYVQINVQDMKNIIF